MFVLQPSAMLPLHSSLPCLHVVIMHVPVSHSAVAFAGRRRRRTRRECSSVLERLFTPLSGRPHNRRSRPHTQLSCRWRRRRYRCRRAARQRSRCRSRRSAARPFRDRSRSRCRGRRHSWRVLCCSRRRALALDACGRSGRVRAALQPAAAAVVRAVERRLAAVVGHAVAVGHARFTLHPGAAAARALVRGAGALVVAAAAVLVVLEELFAAIVAAVAEAPRAADERAGAGPAIRLRLGRRAHGAAAAAPSASVFNTVSHPLPGLPSQSPKPWAQPS